MSGLATFFRGLAQACEGLAEMCGAPQAAPMAVGAPALPAGARALVEGLLRAAAGRAAADADAPPPDDLDDPDAPAPAAPVLGDAHIHGPPGTQGGPPPVAPDTVPANGEVVAGVTLEACAELDRQRREKGRRQTLAGDPVVAMQVADYYVLNLASHPLSAEDWTRSIEAIPGLADARVDRARRAGLPELTSYATSWDDIEMGLQKAEAIAETLRNDPAYDATDLLDADRAGRIRFWLGGRPQEIDINAPAFQVRDDHAPVQPELPSSLSVPPGVAPVVITAPSPVERAAAPGALTAAAP